jgi:hypothetical protein
MKKTILYQCEICGNESADKTVIEHCEAQGRRVVFGRGQTVLYHTLGAGWRTGKILSIRFAENTHKPFYTINSLGYNHVSRDVPEDCLKSLVDGWNKRRAATL